MVKYTAEDKLQAVERYLSGTESSNDIAKSLGTDNKEISNSSIFNALPLYFSNFLGVNSRNFGTILF